MEEEKGSSRFFGVCFDRERLEFLCFIRFLFIFVILYIYIYRYRYSYVYIIIFKVMIWIFNFKLLGVFELRMGFRVREVISRVRF